MNIHEYQAKELLAKFGVSVPRGGVAYTAAEAVKAARHLAGSVWVVKAQIHAGGRGKAGGVTLCRSEEAVATAAREVNLHVPLVVRLEGTNVDLGKKILQQSGLPILAAENLADAAQKIVRAVREAA